MVYKPVGITSSDLVLKIKRNLKFSKIGHTGTLDKFAEGLMILPFGKFTAFSNYFLGQDKSYFTKVRFGIITDSGDRDGEIIQKWEQKEVERFYSENITKIKTEIQNILHLKTQIPPKVSALKVNGKRQSTLYRQGIEFGSKPRNIFVYNLQFSNLTIDGFEMEIHVSSGTYIRKIVTDLSEKLNFPMHIVQLVRTKIGKQHLEKAQGLEELLISPKITKLEEIIHFPIVRVNIEDEKFIKNGRYISLSEEIGEDTFLIKTIESDKLLAWCSKKSKKSELPYSYLKVFV
ncbi:MAG: tRNA pseudouridine(55) synthase TruB [Leptospiraceae bacterium]|nr:tRNA pseudouridine(55) synthase TruB [Leptospiraceae bacterium]MCP5497807.1 tRNA pseudouridine(55) synthase TruB [Leptospiraceae bacterium]